MPQRSNDSNPFDEIAAAAFEEDIPAPLRPVRGARSDVRRGIYVECVLIMLAMCILFVCYWFMLPTIQSLFTPSAPGGRKGPWVARPTTAMRFGAATMLTSLSVAMIAVPLTKRRRRQRAALETRYQSLNNESDMEIHMTVRGSLALVVFGAALVFYLFSWDFIGPDGIEEHLPWGTRNHAFGEIDALQTVPDGLYSKSVSKTGPWYEIRFRGAQYMSFGIDNEGSTRDDLAAIAAFIAEQSQLEWQTRPDAR